MTQHKWFTGNYRRIVWVCFTILFDQLLKLGQVLLLKKAKRNNFVICGGVIFEIFALECQLDMTPYFRMFSEKSISSPVNYPPPCLPQRIVHFRRIHYTRVCVSWSYVIFMKMFHTYYMNGPILNQRKCKLSNTRPGKYTCTHSAQQC